MLQGQDFSDTRLDVATVEVDGQLTLQESWTFDKVVLSEYTRLDPQTAIYGLNYSGSVENCYYPDDGKICHDFSFGPAWAVAGLHPQVGFDGDFDGNGQLDAIDLGQLTEALHAEDPDLVFDLNFDGSVEASDLSKWVKVFKHTWFGDANLDGEFNSSDMVQVFAAGKYETEEAAGWAEGDWDGSGFFDSSDMVTAFADGGYEKGPQTDAVAVPEPGGWLLLVMAAGVMVTVRRWPCLVMP
jgi:hypothetical protein